MAADSATSAGDVLSRHLLLHPLYHFRRRQEDGYGLRILLAAGKEYLHAALSQLLSNGQLPDTRLEITVCSSTAMEDGFALLEQAPALPRFVEIHGLDPRQEPECTLAVLSFRDDLTPVELTAHRDAWDYVLICTGEEDPCRQEVLRWDFRPEQLTAFVQDDQFFVSFPEYRTAQTEPQISKDLLKQIALNTHYGYQKYVAPRASIQEIETGFSGTYNSSATLKNVMHIRSKLACCGILDADLAAAAHQFAALIREDPDVVSRLAAVEHNRWLMDKLMQGNQLPASAGQLYQRANESTHSEEGKWHVCMLPYDPAHRLTAADWRTDETNCRPELDALDRMSLEVHRVCREIADVNRQTIFDLLDQCERTLSRMPADSAVDKTKAGAYLYSMQNAVSQMYQKKRIAVYRYDKSRQKLLELLKADSRLWAGQLHNHMDCIELYLKPLREYIIDKDYKELNYLMVEQIPFTLTWKLQPILAKLFDVSGEDCQFAPWQLEPKDAIYIGLADSTAHLAELRQKADHIHRFLVYSCSTIHHHFHILVPPGVDPAAVSGDDGTDVTFHSLPSRDSGQIHSVIAAILDQQKPDYIDMTSSSEALRRAAEQYAAAHGIGTFYVRNSRIFNIQGARELEYPAPTKGITVREMFEQTGAILAGCESSRMSDLSNVYRSFWQVSRSTDQWNAFCMFIAEAYRNQKAEKNYPLAALPKKRTPEIRTVSLHSGVLAKLLPVIRELEAEAYMQDIRIKWIVGDLLELTFRTDGTQAANKLAAALSDIDGSHAHNGSYDIKWSGGKPAIQVRKLKIRQAVLPQDCEAEYAGLLRGLAQARVITNLNISGSTVSFEFTAVEFLSALRNSGKVLEYYLYYTALQECQFDDVEMSWLFFHSAEDGAAENELDVTCTKGTTSLFISAKNVTLNTFSDPKFLNYVCYEVSTLASTFGINAKTLLAAPNVPQFENGKRSRLVTRAMSRGVYLLGDRCFEPGNLGEVLDRIVRDENDWCEFLLDSKDPACV